MFESILYTQKIFDEKYIDFSDIWNSEFTLHVILN